MLSLIIPTFNERDNLKVLIPKIVCLLNRISFEIIVVDDNSLDKTADYVRTIAKSDLRIRVVERVGRNGLSSACVEGFLSSSGDVLAVIDADLQHDENLLLSMLDQINDGFDIVLGSRFKGTATRENFSEKRELISKLGNKFANMLFPQRLTDPMSGFFMIKRDVFNQSSPGLSPMGFKVLLDLIASHPNKSELKILEVPFVFKERHHGESKLDSVVMWDFAMYMAERFTFSKLPAKFISFSFIGFLGVFFHMIILKTLMLLGLLFFKSHIFATATTISFNFLLNNFLTYRNRRAKNLKQFTFSLLSFYIVCSLGAVANVGIASYIFNNSSSSWFLSAIAGILVGTFWNYGMSKAVTWR